MLRTLDWNRSVSRLKAHIPVDGNFQTNVPGAPAPSVTSLGPLVGPRGFSQPFQPWKGWLVSGVGALITTASQVAPITAYSSMA